MTISHNVFIFLEYTETPVRIGLQQTQFTVSESEDYLSACAVVQSGSLVGRDIEIHYSVGENGLCKKTWAFIIMYLPTVDLVIQNGTLLFTEEATIQCVAVLVSSVTPGSTDESCLTLTLFETTNFTGLTLNPSTAAICVVSADGENETIV